jgi:hypothetical protein
MIFKILEMHVTMEYRGSVREWVSDGRMEIQGGQKARYEVRGKEQKGTRKAHLNLNPNHRGL